MLWGGLGRRGILGGHYENEGWASGLGWAAADGGVAGQGIVGDKFDDIPRMGEGQLAGTVLTSPFSVKTTPFRLSYRMK